MTSNLSIGLLGKNVNPLDGTEILSVVRICEERLIMLKGKVSC